jgi:hypothetical protein
MSLPSWPEDPRPGIAKLAKEQNRELSKWDHTMIYVYERQLAEAAIARLRIAFMALQTMRGWQDESGVMVPDEALQAIGEIPQ